MSGRIVSIIASGLCCCWATGAPAAESGSGARAFLIASVGAVQDASTTAPTAVRRCHDSDQCGPHGYCATPPGECDGEGRCRRRPQACPENYDPVCGCDGNTYSNACFAAMAGVSVAHPGECAVPCHDNSDCGDTQYCAKLPGDCDGEGRCHDRPTGCPDIWDPVCGCDGNTYPNACDAAAAGVNVAHPGECREICGGIAGIPCDDPGEFCKLPIGHCCCDFQGECTPFPLGCPDNIDPVCGCDGVTYFNECEADAAGVSVDHRGPCEQICGGITGIPCDDGEFCRLPDGQCCCDIQGVCAPIPPACPDVWDPVCGCDGMTYGNRCEAYMAGVSVDYEGECRQVCGGFAGIPCDDGEFCLLPDGHCCCDFQGVCHVIPEACPTIYDPVCGCDGVTHGNRCEAARAGQSVDYAGPCRD